LYIGWKSNPVIIDCRPCGPVTSLETLNTPVLIFCCLFYKAVSNHNVTLVSNGWVYDELEGTWKEEVLIKSRDCLWIFLDGLEKAWKALFRIKSVPTEIRASRLPFTSPERCRYISLLGNCFG